MIELGRARYRLTELGLEYISKSAPERNDMLCRMMLRLPLFNEALATMLLARRKTISKVQIMDLIRSRGYSGSTVGRRARTILSWFEWMERTFGVVQVRRGLVALHRPQRELDLG